MARRSVVMGRRSVRKLAVGRTTLSASAAHTACNVMQRELTGAPGALGAAQARFLFAEILRLIAALRPPSLLSTA